MRFVEITQPGGPEVLKIAEGERPAIEKHEVLIKVHAAGVNRPDILQRQGKYPMPKGLTPIPGLEVSGTIEAIGEEVTTYKVGDAVCALTNGGGYAEFCAVPAAQTLPIPKGISFEEAAAIPETFFTVWANLFQIGKARSQESVLIHGGASGIGTTAMALCKEFGLNVFATVGDDKKIEELKHSATLINYKKDDFEEKVKALTQDQGVDIILDIVGASYFNKNMNLLKKDGRLVIIGFMGGNLVDNFDITNMMVKRITITGSTMRGRNLEEKRAIAEQLKEKVWPALEKGRCKPIIYATYPLEEIAKAHECLDTGTHIGKVVITM
ncbi:NAD(P)H-quinone oxidoreductase [Rosenbergiella collisarenosi]|uniref:NAD(P)H-quinone oxidoreductase n=1 Tax=Rosenbergiella collisarenosi TaxID=1544695 RepID=UPI001BD920E5|nr:NAD(P)H-quinone oxidoreductase [Rosenbergiella collisarenosi]MBT0720283.1 NAD(P)H-quinone oxidoreductase [Rosenbergiella collisarenosi]